MMGPLHKNQDLINRAEAFGFEPAAIKVIEEHLQIKGYDLQTMSDEDKETVLNDIKILDSSFPSSYGYKTLINVMGEYAAPQPTKSSSKVKRFFASLLTKSNKPSATESPTRHLQGEQQEKGDSTEPTVIQEGLGARKKLVEGIQHKAANQGVAKISSDIDGAAAASNRLKINIGVTGQTGSGKSSLVNTLRSLRPREPRAAKTGAVETTLMLEPFVHPTDANILFWDMPGVGSRRFTHEKYVDKVELVKFDFMIICTAERFKNLDAWIIRQCMERKIPFCLVRTKVDIDRDNGFDDCGLGEEEVLESIRSEISRELYEDGLPDAELYLISTKFDLQTKFDFPKLTQYIINNTPKDAKSSLIKVMVSCSKSIILEKNQVFKQEIKRVAHQAATNPDLFEKIVKEEVQNYVEWFGLSREALARFEIDMKKLDGKLINIQQNLQKILNEPVLEYRRGRDVGIWFVLVGYIPGYIYDASVNNEEQKKRTAKLQTEGKNVGAMSYDEIYTCVEISLMEILEQCTRLALGVLEQKQIK